MPERQWTTDERARHWDAAHAGRSGGRASWHQDVPTVSLGLIDALGIDRSAAVVDVGGGTSSLVDHLVDRGFEDVSVLDVSEAALSEARRRIGDAPVAWLHEDVLAWRAERRYDLWHDRAVFHFLVTADDRGSYLQTMSSALRIGGGVVLATFAADGPASCSGLPVARYSAEDLSRVLGEPFELVEARRELHVTPGGVTQPFTWVAGRLTAASR